MKRILAFLLLLTLVFLCVIPAQAAEAEITVQVLASKTDVQIGDTVEYTVVATGSGVVAMQFQVVLPEGLRYVANSGATPPNLAQKLGVPAADWTELSMMFTFYNDIGITFAPGTEILRFSCIAEKKGSWDVDLFELLPFNSDFEEFLPTLQIQSVHVNSGTGEVTEPSLTEPQETVSAPAADNTEEPEPTQPTTQQPDESVTSDPVTEPTVDQQETLPTTEQEHDTEVNRQPQQTEQQSATGNWIWLIGVAGGVAVATVVVMMVIRRKKHP